MNAKDIFLVIAVIFSVISLMLGLGYIVTFALRLPFDLLYPLPIRSLGLLAIAIGVGFLGWTLLYRKPSEVMKSTFITIVKAIKRIEVDQNLGRKESLKVSGPYRVVRHPQYFGASLLLVGWWLVLGFTFLFFGALFLFLWFRFVLIPFEEKELMAIFGDEYKNYMKQVPGIIPFTNIFRN